MSVYELHLVESANANFTASVLAQLCDGFGIKAYELFAPAPPIAKRRVGRPRSTGRDAPTGEDATNRADLPTGGDGPVGPEVPKDGASG